MSTVSPPPRLQPLVRARVRALGGAGEAWQRDLPARLDRVARRWRLTLGRGLPGGSNSYVCRVTTAVGSSAVLKVCLPSEEIGGQADTLRCADGRGYVRLLGADESERALLLEDLGPPLSRSGLTVNGQLAVLADTLTQAWLAPDTLSRPPGPPVKAVELAAGIEQNWIGTGRPCPERLVAAALDDADWLHRHPADRPVVVHGDPHPENALRARSARSGAETGYVLVDPSPFVDDPCYDLGVAIRDYARSVLAADRPGELVAGWARLLAGRTGLDPDRIGRWAFLERVSSGLYVLSFGAEAVARPFLDSALRLLDDGLGAR